MLEPTSRFSKTVATGIRVSRNTQAPLRRSGTLSTAGHCDQSRAAMGILLPSGEAIGAGKVLGLQAAELVTAPRIAVLKPSARASTEFASIARPRRRILLPR